MKVSSSKETIERKSAYRQKASLQNDVERMENPFRNLHPKIYHRQRNASNKIIIEKSKQMTGPLLRLNVKTEPQSRLLSSSPLMRAKDYSAVGRETRRTISTNGLKKDHLYVEGSFDTDTYVNGKDKLAYMNQRNITLSSKDLIQEEKKFIFPLIVMPGNQSKENTESVNSSFALPRKSHQDFLPRIRYGSFISMVYEEEKKKRRKWRKRDRDSQASRGEPQDNSLLKTTSACPPSATATEDNQNENFVIPQSEKCTDDSQGYRTIAKSDARLTEHRCKDNMESIYAKNKGDLNSRNVNQATSPKTSTSEYSYNDEGINSDLILLKAKLHRSPHL